MIDPICGPFVYPSDDNKVLRTCSVVSWKGGVPVFISWMQRHESAEPGTYVYTMYIANLEWMGTEIQDSHRHNLESLYFKHKITESYVPKNCDFNE
jgi:hypothetical protein